MVVEKSDHIYLYVSLFPCIHFSTKIYVKHVPTRSANAATIKASHGCHGAYSVKENERDKFEVEPWMLNPFNPPNKIFWLICPSHQVCIFILWC